jgi:hypothetical protein
VNDLRLDHIEHADALTYLRTLPDRCVNCVVTSPPYFGLRNYQVDGQIGLEPTPGEYVAALVEVFREVRRVLRDDGVVFLNIGDSYSSGGRTTQVVQSVRTAKGATKRDVEHDAASGKHANLNGTAMRPPVIDGLGSKQLLGIPWRVAFGLQDDGWVLRADIIWCLSGGAWVYARTQKGDMPMMVRDMYRLDPSTVQLWNGQKWTQVLGMSQSERRGDELEIVLRSGERVSCTATHEWPTDRGLLRADALRVGDVLQSCTLPEPDEPLTPELVGDDAAWFVGMYLAEGSRSDDTIQIAGHAKESARWERLQRIAAAYGGTATRTISGNQMSIRMHGRILHALIDTYISGRTAIDKGLKPVCWRYSNAWLRALLDGYLAGDGHYDAANDRWRLGFTRNYKWERDLRTLAARLGFSLTLHMSEARIGDKRYKTFKGELRFNRNGYRTERPRAEIVEIRAARCRVVYDIGVADEPHLFALASGVLTHNSKPNPMPESVTDRPTRSHEYIFLLAKGPKYWYDAAAVAEEAVGGGGGDFIADHETIQPEHGGVSRTGRWARNGRAAVTTRNRRTVWTITPANYADAHFATFPEAIPEICIKAGCPEWCCEKCGAPWVAQVERELVNTEGWGMATKDHTGNISGSQSMLRNGKGRAGDSITTHHGYAPSCACNAGKRAGVVLDIFMGAGTTALVAKKLNRRYLGCDLNADYVRMAIDRVDGISYTLFSLMEVTGD